MGWSITDVEAASLWQLNAAVDGFNKANNPDGEMPEPPSDEWFDDAKARLLN
jgi:hypothetical protein